MLHEHAFGAPNRKSGKLYPLSLTDRELLYHERKTLT
jgi:hypothetical protein